MRFKSGQIVATIGVHTKMQDDEEFLKFVRTSLERYLNCDWGDISDADKKYNDYSVENEERILAMYKRPGADDSIYIITEWDRSATTILFPSEY